MNMFNEIFRLVGQWATTVLRIVVIFFLIELLILWMGWKKCKAIRLAERRKRLLDVMEAFAVIQIELLRKRGFGDDTFEIEIAKYLKDYLLDCLVRGRAPSSAKLAVHPYIVLKYPAVFEKLRDIVPVPYEAEGVWKMKKAHMEDVVKDFEARNRNLQKEYDAWRQAKENEHCLGVYVDCAFIEARKSFSEYCHLEETVPFEVMLQCEQQYEKGNSSNSDVKALIIEF